MQRANDNVRMVFWTVFMASYFQQMELVQRLHQQKMTVS